MAGETEADGPRDGAPARRPVNDLGWIDRALVGARPKAVAALLRYFRDLDAAEEAFQEACLRALSNWPAKGPPRDPAAWLIFAGRNAGIDRIRRRSRDTELPPDDLISDLGDVEEAAVERIDAADYRDDILRLLFVCCHPDLPSTQQIALALRIVSGLTVEEIARAFLVTPAAMEQRITRAKRRVHAGEVPFEAPSPAERDARLGTVSAMIYLVFAEGHSASGGDAHVRATLCDEAIRLARLLCELFPEAAEPVGLLALMLMTHARTPARLDADGDLVLLDEQDRGLWDRSMIAEGVTLLERATALGRTGPYQLQATIAAAHALAPTAAATDWARIGRLYRMLIAIDPSPVVALNHAVAVAKVDGPAAALALVEPLRAELEAYFNFHGVRGALLGQLGREEEAAEALVRAIALARTAAEATHIRRHLDALGRNGPSPSAQPG